MIQNLPSEFFASFSLLLTAMGIVVFVVGLLIGLGFRGTLPLSLDFWMAAGLLRLAGNGTWHTITLSAGIVVLRKISTFGLGASAQKVGANA